ncbi:hypothetical protein J3R82DRAFT_7347 [Butyriboletus roseoflavus]|nr:hypothetical protein J3R82DRAFT_7347 [Butyriboletus roseoflavus]
MHFFASSNIIAMSIIVYLCVVAPSASGKTGQGTAGLSRYRRDVSQTKPTRPAGVPKPGHDNRHNTSSISAMETAAARRNRNKDKGTSRKNTTKVRPGSGSRAGTPTKRRRQNEQPTPEPTGDASASTTVYIDGASAFALLLPQSSGEMVSSAESDGVTYCTDGSGCGNPFPDGFITGAAYSAAADGSYVQVGEAIWVTDHESELVGAGSPLRTAMTVDSLTTGSLMVHSALMEAMVQALSNSKTFVSARMIPVD